MRGAGGRCSASSDRTARPSRASPAAGVRRVRRPARRGAAHAMPGHGRPRRCRRASTPGHRRPRSGRSRSRPARPTPRRRWRHRRPDGAPPASARVRRPARRAASAPSRKPAVRPGAPCWDRCPSRSGSPRAPCRVTQYSAWSATPTARKGRARRLSQRSDGDRQREHGEHPGQSRAAVRQRVGQGGLDMGVPGRLSARCGDQGRADRSAGPVGREEPQHRRECPEGRPHEEGRTRAERPRRCRRGRRCRARRRPPAHRSATPAARSTGRAGRHPARRSTGTPCP